MINTIELFAGVGGFRIGLEREDRFRVVWGNQWEPARKRQDAFDCYARNFFSKGIHSNEDIATIDTKQFTGQDIQLIVGGFPCFAAGTLITTSEGVKPIEKIRKGDMVLTHTNTFKKVVVPMVKKKKGIYELKVQGSPKTLVTEEHPIYVRERKRTWDNQIKSYKTVWSEPKWVETKDLIKGVHFIAMSENKNSYNPHNLTREDAWLIGRYVADGYICDGKRSGRKNSYNNQVIFCVGKDKIEEFKKNVTSYYVGISEERTVYKCRIVNEWLRLLCAETGRGARNKRIPGFIIDLPKDLLKKFLDGYMSGDGSKQGNLYRANSTSKELIYGLGQIVQKLYNTPYRIHFTERPKKTVIEGRVINQQDIWEIRFYKENIKRPTGHYIDGMLYMPIKSLEYQKDFNDYVYNFEVEGDNSYVANNLTVHNCQDYSVARSRSNEKGIEGKKGVLFWEIIRLLHDIKPRYVLLENVDRLLKAPSKQRGRDFSIMLASLRDEGYNVEWRVINAADYGNAQRRRRVFIFASLNKSPYYLNRKDKTFQEVIHQSGFFSPKFPIETEISKKKKPQIFKLPKDILSISDHFSAEYFNAGIMINGSVYTEEVTPIKEEPITLGDILEKDVDEKYYLTTEKLERFKYLKGAKRIPRVSKSGHAYVYSEGPVAFPDPLDKPGRTMLTSEGSVNRSTHVVKDPQTNRLRLLTPVECERLNGFPDGWTEGMSDRMRYFTMGNALVIGLIERMANRISEIDEENVK